MSDQLEWELCVAHGLNVPQLRVLSDALQEQLDPELWGFAALGDIEDVEQRAVISDQLLASVTGIRTNLLELSLSLSDYHDLTAGGLAIPSPPNWVEGFEHHLRAEMAQVAVFRAIGSALDCLAAVAIVIMRVPRSPTYADVRDLDRLRRMQDQATRDSDREALGDVADVVEHYLSDGLKWSLEMRNAVVHRGRQIGFLLPRPQPEGLVIATANPMQTARDRARADRYLHRRPWLPEMEHLADTEAGIEGQWINESVQITMTALKADLVDLVDHLSGALFAAWSGPGADGLFVAPVDKWVLRDPPDLDFAGYAPMTEHAPLSHLHANPSTARRMELAERLRRRRS
jgi:hypothetical protein